MAAEKGVLKRLSSIIEPPSAGILIIGDEILKGHTKDTNSQFLLTRLWSLGVKVKAVSVISDDVDEIASHVSDFSSRFTYVLTSGGIGPTHDDVTMIAIAKAFNEPLVQNQCFADTLVEVYEVNDISELSSFDLKMAQLPSSCKLSYDQHGENINLFPLISIHNVYIFPGIPKLLESLFDAHVHLFSNPQSRFYLQKVYLSVDESVVAAELQEVHDKYGHRVHLGSYPEIGCQEFKTKLTLESLKPNILAQAVDYLTSLLPDNAIVRMESCASGEIDSQTNDVLKKDPDCPSVEKIYSLVSTRDISKLSALVKGAWAVLQETLVQYRLDELCISFNGGKDCTALLALYHAAILKKYPTFAGKLNALYVQGDSPFLEAEEFISECSARYNLNVITIRSGIKESLEHLQASHPRISGILMGTRKHDPYSGRLNLFSPTDPGWPNYMRINPILNWHYSDVWYVLQECEIAYMSLYDQGYTSIGSRHNTQPNPSLKMENGEYKPAYMLEDESKEREGRF